MTLKLFILHSVVALFLLTTPSHSYASSEIGTLDTIHYIPPVYAKSGLGAPYDIGTHYLYLSTLETTAFNVTITNASGLNQVVSVSKLAPAKVDLTAGDYLSLGNTISTSAINIVTDSDTSASGARFANTVNSTDGLLLTGTQRFYANIRHQSDNQGGSLVAKGRTALGKRFRSGHIYTNSVNQSAKAHFISVMATEDDTDIEFSGLPDGITLVSNSPDIITGQVINLDANESFVIAMRLADGTNSSITNGLNGTLVIADKPIAMNSGSWLAGQEQGRDLGFDQIIPTSYIGTLYIAAEGSGGVLGGGGDGDNTDILEVPMVISDTNDTSVYINGSTTPECTITWAGGYCAISGENFTNGSMFIRTSQPAYVYQNTSSNNISGQSLNLLAPLADNSNIQSLLVPEVEQLGTTIISIVTTTTATVNIITTTASPPVPAGVDLTGGVAVPGTAEYLLYTVNDAEGDLEISADEPFSFSMTTTDGARGASAYFSGFPNSWAVDDTATTQLLTDVIINVQDNDIDGNNTFTVQSTLTVAPTNGTAVVNGGSTITYSPLAGFTTNKTDTFTYEIRNGDASIIDTAVVVVNLDTDADGVNDVDDLDSDNDGILDTIEIANASGSGDTDGDGVNDEDDLDSDNDGIFDLVEAGHGATDSDNDGRIDSTEFVGVNGFVDTLETVAESGIQNYTVTTTQADGFEDYRDLDSDGDGIPDNIEAQAAASYIAPNASYNENGVDTAYLTGLTPLDSIEASASDYQNTDSDGQGNNDTLEAGLTLSGNVGSNGLDNNIDNGDNYADVNGSINDPADANELPDEDNDNIPDYQDATGLTPTDLLIDAGNSDTVNENSASGTVVGALTTTDSDSGDSFTYTLVAGTGDEDNALFTIDGANLELNFIPDFEVPLDTGGTDGDNTYSVRVRSTDSYSLFYEESISISVNDLDEIAPVVSIEDLAVANIANNTSYPIDGTCTTGDGDVTVSISGATPASQDVTCLGANTWSATFNVSGLPNGDEAVVADAEQTDAAGNTGNAPQQKAKHDKVAPTVVITSPVVATLANEENYPVSGTCSNLNNDVKVTITGVTPQNLNCDSNNWSGTFNVSGITDDLNAIIINAEQDDIAGNTGYATQQTADKDTIVPTVTITTSTTANSTNDDSYSVTGACESTQNVTVSLTGLADEVTACSGSAWTVAFDVSGIPDNTNALTINATQTDAAGNVGNAAQVQNDKDTVIPVVTISSLTPANIANNSAYPVDGTCTAGDGDVTVSIAGATPENQDVSCSGAGAWNAVFDVSGITNGTEAIVVDAEQTDTASNTGNAVQQKTQHDKIAPTVIITTPTTATFANQENYPVSGTCTNLNTDVIVTITGVTPAQNIDCNSFAWSSTFDVSDVTDGTNVIIINAQQDDLVNNTGYAAQQTADKDTVGPAVIITTTATANEANETNYVIEGSCESTELVTVAIDGLADKTDTCSGNSWSVSFDVSSISDGLNIITINASQPDELGNIGNATQVQNDKDATAPSISTTSTTTATLANYTAYTASGTCQTADGLVTVAIASATPASQTTTCSGNTWSANFNVTGVSDGSDVIDISASQTDAQGNTGNATLVENDKDATAPIVSTTSTTTATLANRAAYTASGTCQSADGNVTVAIADATPASQSVTCSTNTWSANFNVTSIDDGTDVIDISASQTDSQGNTGSATLVENDKDASAPIVATTSSTTATLANRAAYTASGTCQSADGDVTVAIADATPTSQSVSCTTNTWSANFDVTAITDGTDVIDISASQTDSQGNTGNATLVENDKDATAPVVATTSSTTATLANRAAYTASGTCQAADGNVTVAITGATPASQSVSCTTNTWSANFDVTVITDGTDVIDISASQTDSQGNTGNATLVENDKDATAPVVATTSSTTATLANRAAYTASGTCQTADGNVTVAITGATPASQSVSCTTNTWSANFDVTAITDGTDVIDISASQTDSQGNIGSATLVENDKDATAPVVATTSNTMATLANRAAYTASGTCQTADGNVTVAITSATPASQSVSCTTNTWSANFDVTAITDGTDVIDISASQTDSQGNLGSATLVENDKDATAPVVATTSSTTANLANSTVYTASGTCQTADGNVTVAIVDATPASKTTACDTNTWSADFDVTLILDGTDVIDISASQTDAQGNIGSATLVENDKDATAPSVSTTSNTTANSANSASYTASGTCQTLDGNVTVAIVDATPANQTTTCTANLWSVDFDVSLITDGTDVIDISASQTDIQGNKGDAILVENDKDATAPSVSTTSNTTANSANSASYTASGTCQTSAGIVTVAIANATPANQTIACSTNTWSAVFDVTLISDGTDVIDISASQTDAQGNIGTATLVENDKDATAPSVAITSTTTATLANRAAYTASGTCETLDGLVTVAIVNATPANQTTACSTNTWSTDFDVTAIDDGTDVIDISASQTDAIGNTGNAIVVENDKDATAPIVLTTSSTTATSANSAVYTASGTCETIEGLVTVAIAGATPANQTTACTANTWSADFDVTLISDGSDAIDISASQTDALGNVGSATLVENDKDATAPSVTIDAAVIATPTNQLSYPVSGTCNSSDGVITVSIVNVTPAKTANCSGSLWNTNFNVSGISDGTDVIDINASQTDSNGNTGNAVLVEADKDTSAPVLATNTPTTANSSDEENYLLSGSCITGDSAVTVSIAGVSPDQLITCISASWSTTFDVSGLPDGTNVIDINANQTDSGSNIGYAPLVEGDKDTSAPTLSITSTAAAIMTNENNYPVSGTCTDGDGNIDVSITSVSPTQSVSCTSSTWATTFNVSVIADGDNAVIINASQTDAGGNRGDATTVTNDKDSVAPIVTTTSSTTATLANQNTYPVAGTCETSEGDVSVSIAGVSPTQTVSCSANAWSAVFDVSSLANGNKVIDITASQTDALGNIGSATTVENNKDAAAPNIVITSSTTASSSNENNYPVSGTCESVDGSVSVSIVGVLPAQTINCTANAWVTTFDVSSLSDGIDTIDINASQTDAQNNTGNATLVENDKDATAPNVVITSTTTASTVNESDYPVEGSCESADGNISVSIAGISPTQSVSCSANSWTANFDVSILSDGNEVIDINASQTDALGNTGNATLVENNKDTAAPSVAITSTTIATSTNENTYPVAGSCESSEGNVTVSIDTVSPSQDVSCSGDSWSASFDVSGLSDGVGVITINALQTDSQGNIGNAVTINNDKDSSAPIVVITSTTTATTANEDNYPVTGSCESTEGSVSVTLNSLPTQFVDCTLDAWSTSFNVSTIDDGNNVLTIDASQTDMQGNIGNATTVENNKDSSAPIVVITSTDTATSANENNYPVSGTCGSLDGNVALSITGVTPTQSISCTADTWSTTFDVSGLTDGLNTVEINASQTDAQNNTGTAVSVTNNKDTAAPNIAITSTVTASLANETTYPVNGSCESTDGSVSVSIVGVIPTQTASCIADIWSTNFDVSGLTDGINVIEINASQTDAQGNTGNAISIENDKDTTAPNIAITSTTTATINNENSYPVSGSCESSEGNVSVSIASVTPAQSVSCTTNLWSANFNVSSLSDGANVITINASQTDSQSNIGNAITVENNKDTAAPVVTITSTTTASLSNENNYPVTGTCESGEGNVSVTIAGVTQLVGCSANNWSASFDVSALSDGVDIITINASQTDAQSNIGNAATVENNKDTTPPAVAISSITTASSSNENSYPVNGSCEAGSGNISVSITGVTPAQSVSCNASTWSANFNVSGLSDGINTIIINASQTDLQGNSGTAATVENDKDASAPNVMITSTATVNSANESTYPVNGSCESSDGDVTVTITGITPSQTVSCLTNSWSANFNVTPISDGSDVIEINASQTDALGNTGTAPTVEIDKDTTAPIVAITSTITATAVNQSSYPVNGSCETNHGYVAVSITGITPAQSVACISDLWSTNFDVSELLDGSNVIDINASQTDAQGNLGQATSVENDKDSTAPSVVITSTSIAVVNNEASYPVSGTCETSDGDVTVSIANVSPAQNVSCTANAWSTNFNVSPLSDGTDVVDINASQTDAQGNIGHAILVENDKDATAPAVTINSAVIASPTNQLSYQVSGSCTSTDGNVTASIAGITPAKTANCSGANWSTTFNVLSIADGVNVINISASQTDIAGNLGTAPTVAGDKDTSAPILATNIATTANSNDETNYFVSGSCITDFSDVTVSITGITASNIASCASTSWSTTFDVSSLADGIDVIVINASQTDLGSNVGYAPVINGDKDTAAPNISISTSTTAIVNNQNNYPVNGSCETPDGNVAVSIIGVSPAQSVSCSANLWTATFNVSGLADGTDVITINASQTDANNNIGTAITIENDKNATAPNVSITSRTTARMNNESSYPVSGSCESSEGDVSVSIDDILPLQNISCTANAWATTFDVSSLTDGNNVIDINASQTDAQGNLGSATTIENDKDATPPNASVSSTTTATIANENNYPVSGSCESSEGSVAVSIVGVTPTQTVNCTINTWNTNFNVSGLADGNNTIDINASQTDIIGNIGNAATIENNKDTTAPIVAITNTPAVNAANENAYTIGGTCESIEGSVTVSITGVIPAQTVSCLTNAWTATFDVSSVVDNLSAIEINASQTDSVGNTGNAITIDVDKDATAPNVAITTAPEVTSANETAYTIGGTCESSEGNVTVSIAGVTPAQTVNCTANAWTATFDVSTLADNTGAVEISASQTDSSGNAGNAIVVDVDKDATAPNVTTSTSPVVNATNESTYTIGGSCEASAGNVTVTITGVAPVQTVNCTADTWSATFDVSSLTDNANAIEINVSQTDSAGNIGNAPTTNVDKDTIAPVVAITSAPLITTTNVAAYTISGTCEAIDGAVTANIAGITPAQTVNCTANTWNATFDVRLIADNLAAVAISANQTDNAGNIGNALIVEVDKDATAPMVETTTAPIVNAANESSYTISGSCESVEGDVTVSIAGITPAQTVSCTADTWSATFDVSSLDDKADAIDISASQTDSAGNSGNALTVEVAKDTVAPNVVTSTPPNVSADNQNAYTIGGTCESANGDISVSITGITPSQTVSCISDTWSATFDVSSLDDKAAALEISASQTDSAGNTGNATVIEVDKDATAPTVTTSIAPQVNSANQTTYTIGGACESTEGDVTVSITGITPSQTVGCSTDTWSATFDVSSLADNIAALEINASQIDTTGNLGSAEVITVDKDTNAPIIEIATLNLVNIANENSYTLGGSCTEADGDVSIDISGLVNDTVACSSELWTADVDVSAIADGTDTIVINANQTDSFGNVGKATTQQTDKSTQLPVVTLNSLSAINTLNQAQYLVSGSCSSNDDIVLAEIVGLTAENAICLAGSWEASFDTTSLDDSESIIVVSASHTDRFNNTGIATQVNITKDTIVPTFSIVIEDTMLSLSQLSAFDMSGTTTAEDNQMITFTFSDTINPDLIVSTQVLNESWKIDDVDLTSLNDGDVSISIMLTDIAGNPADTDIETISLDRVAPLLLANDILHAIDRTPLLVGTTDQGINSLISIVNTDNNNVCQTIIITNELVNNWACEIQTELSFGQQTLTAQTTDLAGNTSRAPFTVIISRDEDQNGLPDDIYPPIDTDNDSIPDHIDPDDDNDGIPDSEENSGIPPLTGNDSDNDGIDDAIDVDETGGVDNNNDGIDDALDGDSDDDGIPDAQDIDSDNDRIPDVVEGNVDTDGDGIKNLLDLDSDNDGIPDIIEGQIADVDSDNDHIKDHFDVDITGGEDLNQDGIDDNRQAHNSDSDNTPDYLDLDSDNDTINDVTEAGLTDKNGDALADKKVPEDNILAINLPDTDNDGVFDHLDLDSNANGIFDIVTANNAALDANNDGQIDDTFDRDNDGIPDVSDGEPLIFGDDLDSDHDGVPNSYDLDSDNDGISDEIEHQNIPAFENIDTDNDGIDDSIDVSQTLGQDLNNDGIDDALDGDTDNDGIADIFDLDSDNDGIMDIIESGYNNFTGENTNENIDQDNDGQIDNLIDENNDGIDDRLAITPDVSDADNDGIPDFKDLDSDNDGIFDIIESVSITVTYDIDNDGQVDGVVDNDKDGLNDLLDISVGNGQSGTAILPIDTDSDGIYNFRDFDSDNDGFSDQDEYGDYNQDGISDHVQNVGKIKTSVKGGSFSVFALIFILLVRIFVSDRRTIKALYLSYLTFDLFPGIEATHSENDENEIIAIKETHAPKVKILTAGPVNLNNAKNYAVSGSCESLQVVEIEIKDLITLTDTCSNNTWSVLFDVSTIPDGEQVVHIIAMQTDAFGNIGKSPAVLNDKDTHAPVITISSKSDANKENETHYVIYGRCESTERVTIKVAGLRDKSDICTDGAWASVFDVSSLSDGLAAININVYQTDIFGNVGKSPPHANNKYSESTVIAALPVSKPSPITVKTTSAESPSSIENAVVAIPLTKASSKTEPATKSKIAPKIEPTTQSTKTTTPVIAAKAPVKKISTSNKSIKEAEPKKETVQSAAGAKSPVEKSYFQSIFYAGLGINYSRLKPQGNVNGWSLDNSNSLGASLHFGQQFHQHWFWEFDYLSAGKATLKNINPSLNKPENDIAISYQIPSLVIGYDFLKKNIGWNFYAKAGVSSIITDSTDYRIVEENQTSIQFNYGLGVKYQFKNMPLNARLAYQHYSADAQTFGLMLSYRFGE